MFRKVLLTIGLILAANVAVFAQGTLRGTVKDASTGEPLLQATVMAKQNGQMVTGAVTDFDGMYTIKGLAVGKYDIEVSYVGYQSILKTGVEVSASDFTIQNFGLKQGSEMLKTLEVQTQKVPVIQMGSATTGQRLSSDDIEKMPGTSVESIVSQVGGVGYSDGGTSTARGADGMVTQVSGVRVRTGVNVPKEAIAEIQVILGGTPASIGEAIGGTQIVTLKPPSSKFNGMVRYEGWLDYRLANSLITYLTGPLFVKHVTLPDGGTMDRTTLGFRFTGQASYSNFGYYRASEGRYQVVNDDKVVELEKNPIVYDPVTGAVNYAAEYLRSDDFVTIKRPTAKNYYASNDRYSDFSSYSIATQLALVFRFSDYSTLELTGEFDYSKSPSTSLAYFPLNLTRAAYGVSDYNNLVIRADYQQRFPDEQPAAAGETLPAGKKASINNIMFAINAMYNRSASKNYNENFGDNVFEYGHIGVFTTEQSAHYTENDAFAYNGTTIAARVQDSWQEKVTSFTPSEYNPILANYTTQLYNMSELSSLMTNFNNIRAYNGLVNGDSPASVYSLFSNVGVQNTTYAKSLTNYFYLAAKASANIGKHELEIGYQFDRYSSSYYGLDAASLWTIMRNSANAHITQLDLNNPIVRYDGSYTYVDYNRLNGGGQTHFDAAMREALGLDANSTSWIDIDRYTPDFYDKNGGLDMFSSNELFNSGNAKVSYYGYDHTGDKYSSKGWSLDDFFDPVAKGHKSYQYLPAFAPTYMAGYLQDKFAFEDLIFNVGVRVDYYDGNQMVLKDPYLLYESYTVGDLKGSSVSYNTGLTGNAFANNAQDDWVVYVDDPSATTPTVTGYRNGSIWYNAEGVEVSSPSAVSGEAGRPTPFRTKGEGGGQETATTGNASGNQISSAAFEDYKPQIVPMPRIAFSFPVGEKSQFKANYDIIARRPSSGWQADYLSYLYMTQATSISNPNLKPERVTNYEVSFQQALTDFMGVSLAAYYKETRDLIQLVQYAGADPNQNYYSYDNLDFMTTKGFTFTYDLRQTKNIRISANYTLQYAEGTGLSTTTMSELIREGYTTLKMLNPISDDRRHEFKANVDFRYESGAKYNGPVFKRAVKDKKTGETKVKEIRPLENFGINFNAVAQSGRPYTRAYSITQSTIVGSYRGARLPWAFYFDVVVDKTWPIIIKDKDGNVKRNTALNVALTVYNLFDLRNITGVFSVTGNPTDNGYLTDPETQSVINAYLDPQSYRDMYAIYLNNSYWNYSSPRTIKLGLTYQF
jgi:hypothetical protein